jgi:hypothetical protein
LVAETSRTSARRAAGADPLELAGLQDAQQLGLQRHRHGADLVQEERPAVGAVSK